MVVPACARGHTRRPSRRTLARTVAVVLAVWPGGMARPLRPSGGAALSVIELVALALAAALGVAAACELALADPEHPEEE